MKQNFVLIILACCFIASAISAAETHEPKIGLKEALVRAEKYVEDKKLDVSALPLAGIYRSEPPNAPNQNCWTIIWAPKDPRILDGELRIYIYDDGRIEHGGSA